jgi:ribosomal protein S18 acetylase RimI-like enzyme
MGYVAMSKDRPKTVLLHQLYVLPRYQRQGIGRDMFAELETCFPDANTMLLEVDPRNDAAVAFYHAHGFAKVGEAAHTADDVSGVPLHVYEKPLSG